MDDRRIGGDHRPRTQHAGPAAQIRLFAVHEEYRVKTLQLPPQVGVDQQETARHDIDFAHRVAFPRRHPFGIEEIGVGKQLGQSQRKTRHAPQSLLLPARCVIERQIAKQRASAPDPRRRAGFGKSDQPVHRPIKHHRIGVEQQHPPSARMLDRHVVGDGKPVIDGFRKQPHLRKFFGNGGGRPVMRTIVDQQNFEIGVESLGIERAQALERHFARVPVNYNY